MSVLHTHSRVTTALLLVASECQRFRVLPNDDRRERRSRSNADTIGVCCEFWELNSDDFLFLMCFSLMVYERNQRRTNR